MATTNRGTVVVTGASSGIGREFALALGPSAQKLVLVARREDRLRDLAAEIIERNDNAAWFSAQLADLAKEE